MPFCRIFSFLFDKEFFIIKSNQKRGCIGKEKILKKDDNNDLSDISDSKFLIITEKIARIRPLKKLKEIFQNFEPIIESQVDSFQVTRHRSDFPFIQLVPVGEPVGFTLILTKTKIFYLSCKFLSIFHHLKCSRSNAKQINNRLWFCFSFISFKTTKKHKYLIIVSKPIPV